MSSVEIAEETIQRLSPQELVEFSRWFDEYRAAKWDAQIARDAEAGKLDALAEEALTEYRAGRCTKFPS